MDKLFYFILFYQILAHCLAVESSVIWKPLTNKTRINASSFTHPGMLHSQSDLDRMRQGVANQIEPILQGFNKLINNGHSRSGQNPRPVEIIYRGGGTPQNYAVLYNDAATAYASALRWHITGETVYADQAVLFLDAWGSTLKEISGASADSALAAGIYGYELANAAELMRGYEGWSQESFDRFREMMTNVFYPTSSLFINSHWGNTNGHYWSNWDICSFTTVLSIGILTDNQDIVDEAVNYFKTGPGMGSINNMVWHVYDGENAGLAQLQESGRDQGHTLLSVGLMATFLQTAWNQGLDLYAYDDNRFMKGAEYAAKYNLGYDVPFTLYSNGDYTHTEISSNARGNIRPIWEQLYNHYGVIKGLDVPYIKEFAIQVRPEGGGGDYDTTSGGYDHLGFGTLTFSIV